MSGPLKKQEVLTKHWRGVLTQAQSLLDTRLATAGSHFKASYRCGGSGNRAGASETEGQAVNLLAKTSAGTMFLGTRQERGGGRT